MLIEQVLYNNCEIILMVIIFISGTVTLIQKHFAKKVAEERREDERKKEELELKSFIEPLKADIKTIINNKIQQLSAKTCPQCSSIGVNLKRTYIRYQEVMRETEGWYSEEYEYIDKSGEKWPATRTERWEGEVFDHSDFKFDVEAVCQKCGYVHFSDKIYYKDETYNYEKMKRFSTYKDDEVISIDAFLTDIYPQATYYQKNLNAYNELLDHLRNSWK